jgi:hypothetical protein
VPDGHVEGGAIGLVWFEDAQLGHHHLVHRRSLGNAGRCIQCLIGASPEVLERFAPVKPRFGEADPERVLSGRGPTGGRRR